MDTYKLWFECGSIEVLQAPTLVAAIKRSAAAKSEAITHIEQTTRDGKPVFKKSFFDGSRGTETWQSCAI